MKKHVISFILTALMCFSGAACNTQTEVKEVVAGKVTSKDGITYIEVDGKPFQYIGMQFRTDGFMNCDYKKVDDLKPYFAAIADLNVPTVQLPLEWRDIEVEEDKYDFTYIDKTLSFAEEYGLKVEYLWFSTNMCGETHSFHIPDYILDNSNTYARYNTTYTGQFWPIYGQICHMVFGGDNLLARETKVVERIMRHIAERNASLNYPNTLIGVQVHNEPDCFPLWRVGQNQISVLKDGRQITYDEAAADVNKALDTVGKAFKSTGYKIYTRVNFALANVMNEYIESVYNLEGIDIVGDDPHENNVSTITGAIREYSLTGNYPHIAENRATFENTPSMILATLALNGGYIMYEIATPETFLKNTAPDTDPDYGILNGDLSYRANTQSVKDFLGMIKNAGGDIITTSKEKFHAFNIEGNFPVGNYSKSIVTAKGNVDISTMRGAIGFALDCRDYLLVGATDVTQFTVSGAQNVTEGGFNGEQWVESETVVMENNVFSARAYKVYKIKY